METLIDIESRIKYISFIKGLIKTLAIYNKEYKKIYNHNQRVHSAAMKLKTFDEQNKYSAQNGKHYPAYPYKKGYYERFNLTFTHILYNQLRHKKPHTKDDVKHVDSNDYKKCILRIYTIFELSQVEKAGGSNVS